MSCNDLIQFDTVESSNSLVNFYSFLSFVNEQNYENAKNNISGSYLDYFSGSYENFLEKKKNLTKLFQQIGYTDIQNNYRHHILSPVGAKAYAECIRENSKKQLSVWIESITSDRIAIGIKNGLGGNSIIDVTVENDSIEKKIELPSNSEDFVIFNYDSKFDVMIKVRSVERNINSVLSEIITVPKVRNFKEYYEDKELVGYIEIGAGGYDSYEKNSYCRDFIFVADTDFILLPETLKQSERKVLGQHSIRSFNPIVEEIDQHVEVKQLKISANSITGSHKHTQSQERVYYSIIERRKFITEENN